jgi:hypothetical protein
MWLTVNKKMVLHPDILVLVWSSCFLSKRAQSNLHKCQRGTSFPLPQLRSHKRRIGNDSDGIPIARCAETARAASKEQSVTGICLGQPVRSNLSCSGSQPR